jgi:hypothetical protein
MTRTRPLVAALIAGGALPMLAGALALPAWAAGLTKSEAKAEQQACLERAKGSIKGAKKACTCMVEGLSEGLSAADYAALAALLNDGVSTPEAEAAHEIAKQIVQQCLAVSG